MTPHHPRDFKACEIALPSLASKIKHEKPQTYNDDFVEEGVGSDRGEALGDNTLKAAPWGYHTEDCP